MSILALTVETSTTGDVQVFIQPKSRSTFVFLAKPLTKYFQNLSLRDPRRGEKGKNYFEVESIVDWRTSRDKNLEGRDFKIKWKGYDETTWEPEENLNGAVDVLQAYCRREKLPASHIEYIYGATTKEETNEANWLGIAKILFFFKKVKKYYNITSPPTEEFKSFGQTDAILLLGHNLHMYVMLYLAKKKEVYIADGMNNFIHNMDARNSILEKFERPEFNFRQVYFENQTRVDHCCSSAVLIAAAFATAYGNNNIPRTLTVRPVLWKYIVKKMHPFTSKNIASKARIWELKERKIFCPYCSFKGQKNAIQLHVMRCHSDKREI